jgi:hypothetical protein
MLSVRLLPVCFLALCLTLSAQADEGPPRKPGEPGKPGPEKAPAKKAPPKKAPPRLRIRATLKKTVVHFSFQRAPLEDILLALERATKVKVRIGRAGRRTLEKRKFKIKYVADRTGLQVLQDVCKAGALDFLVSDEGVLVDLPKTIKKLRRKLSLNETALRLSAKDVAKMLVTKELSLSSRKKRLSTVLAFLTQETGVRFVRMSPAKDAKKKGHKRPAPRTDPAITIHTTSTPLGKILDLALHPVGLDWVRTGSVILVGTKKQVTEQRKPLPRRPPGKR